MSVPPVPRSEGKFPSLVLWTNPANHLWGFITLSRIKSLCGSACSVVKQLSLDLGEKSVSVMLVNIQQNLVESHLGKSQFWVKLFNLNGKLVFEFSRQKSLFNWYYISIFASKIAFKSDLFDFAILIRLPQCGVQTLRSHDLHRQNDHLSNPKKYIGNSQKRARFGI